VRAADAKRRAWSLLVDARDCATPQRPWARCGSKVLMCRGAGRRDATEPREPAAGADTVTPDRLRSPSHPGDSMANQWLMAELGGG